MPRRRPATAIGSVAAVVLTLLLVVPGIAQPPSDRNAGVTPGASRSIDRSISEARPAGGPPTYLGTTSLGQGATHASPTSVVPDPANGDLYVTNFGAVAAGGNTVSVINATTRTTLATLPVGDDPIYSVFDAADGIDYTLNYGVTNNVSAINGTTIVASIPVGLSPRWGLYDPANQYVYVVNYKSGNVSILHGLSVVASPVVGSSPGFPTLDSSTGEVYVPNAGSNNVSVINGTAVVATVPVGTNPEGTVFDPATGDVIVTNTLSGNVSIVSGAKVVANVAVGLTPIFGAYDPLNSYVYIADGGSDSVHILYGSTVVTNLSVGSAPGGTAFDPASGNIYVADLGSSDVTILNGTAEIARVETGLTPYTATYDPLTATVDVPDFNAANYSVIGTPASAHPLALTETGLPVPSWQLVLNTSRYYLAASSETVPEANARYNYTVPPLPGFVATAPTGNATVAGATTLAVHFNESFGVEFAATGLAPGTSWSVTVRNATGVGSTVGGSTTDLNLSLPNGSFQRLAVVVSGYDVVPAAGFTVGGSVLDLPLTFYAFAWPLFVNETGLFAGTSWTISIDGAPVTASTSTQRFSEPNGSYNVTPGPVPGFYRTPGPRAVAVDGAAAHLAVRYNETFSVNFTESGLPGGTEWLILYGPNRTGAGQNGSSTKAGYLVGPEVNGSYGYTALSANGGYVGVRNGTGGFRVDGSNVSVPIFFQSVYANATPDQVLFNETGLPASTPWSVTINGTRVLGSGATIAAWLAPGNYPYSVAAAGYTGSPPGGTVELTGPTTTVKELFTGPPPASYPVTFRAIGLVVVYGGPFDGGPLRTLENWSVTVNGRTNFSAAAATSIVVELPNGTYPFVLGGARDFVFDHRGTVTVRGGPASANISFSLQTYPVQFDVSGLPDGTSWSVQVALTSLVNASSTTTSLTVHAANGSWTYSVGTISGYRGPNGGTFAVNGGVPPPITLAFSPIGGGGLGNGTGTGPSLLGSELLALGGGVAVAALVAALWLVRRGRRPGTLDSAPSDPETPDDANVSSA